MAGVGGEGSSEPGKELLLHGLGCRMGQAFQASRCRQFDLQLLVASCKPVDQDGNRRLIHTAVRTAPGFDRLCVRRIPLPEPRPLTNLLLVVAGQAFVKIIVAIGIWRDPATLGKMPDHLTGHVVPTRGETAFALEVFEEDGTPEPARAALGAKELAFTGRNGERLQEFLRRDMLMHGDLIEDKGACHKRGFARAKVSPKPWEEEKSYEIGCCCPGGEHLKVQVLPDESRANRSVANPRASP